MERYMVTHSLLSSWLYAMKDNPYADVENEPDDPLEEFQRVLNREPTKTTEAMQNGIDFEDLVTDIWSGDEVDQSNPWFESAQMIADIVAGGLLQVKCGKTIQINGMNIFLYGRLDALKAGIIYDIKLSKGYERGKFYESTQHPMYFELVPDAYSFSYLVSDGRNFWTETYRRDEVQSIIPTISGFLEWLNDNGLMDTYKDKWLAL